MLLLVCLAYCLGGCYSLEFFPEPDYPNLRRSDVDKVEVRTQRPERPFFTLGTLLFKNFAGDTRDEAFLNKVKSEARERGAGGAWITSRHVTRMTIFNTENTHHRQRDRRTPTGSIQGSMGVVRIILYNYDERAEKSE